MSLGQNDGIVSSSTMNIRVWKAMKYKIIPFLTGQYLLKLRQARYNFFIWYWITPMDGYLAWGNNRPGINSQ